MPMFSVSGATTVILPFEDFLISYPAPLVDEPVGSKGMETKYFSDAVKTDRSISPVQVALVLQISVWVVVIEVGRVPVLSIVYW